MDRAGHGMEASPRTVEDLTSEDGLEMSQGHIIESARGNGRRQFLQGTGKLTLSAAVIAMLGGNEALAKGMRQGDAKADVAILNVALGLEWEAINAYQLGAESGLLQKPVLGVAVSFQSHHKEHAEALSQTVIKLGGTPVAPKKKAHYAKALNAGALKSQTDILKLAARLERGAANAYIGVIPSFKNAELAKVAARLAADETMHWTVLASALKQQLPVKALSFGA